MSEIVEAAMSTGTQSTILPGKSGSALIAGCAEVANMMGHISEVFQCPVRVEPLSWPTRRSLVFILRILWACWVILSTVTRQIVGLGF